MKKYFIIILAVVAMAILIVSRFESDNKYITLGTSPDYPPFEYKEGEVIKGFDIEVAKLIAEEFGVELKIKEMEFSSLIPSLKSGKVDFVMAGLTVSAERLKNVSFSNNYYQASIAVITKKRAQITNEKQFINKAIGAQLGSTMEQYVKEKSLYLNDIEIIAISNNMQLIQELKSGRIDAVLVESAQAESFIALNHGLAYNILPNSGGGYAIAFKKKSLLRDEFNKALINLQAAGKLKKLEKEWLSGEATHSNNLFSALAHIPKGALVTLQYASISVVFGIIIGVVLARFKLSTRKSLKLFAEVYTSIFRGTPLLVQLSIFYFALPVVLGVDVPAFVAGIMTFSLNSAAYVSEIIRAGVLAVDKGQYQAARSLGIPEKLVMKDIIQPQALAKITPSLVNEMIDLLKESAIISVIGEADLMRRAQIVAAQQYTYLEPLLVAALCYYILVLGLTFLGKYLEKKLAIQ
jgi:arginine/lysine/histidine transport system permease protein/arginine/lysine/histidine transporter system substrate-binding protein